MRDTLPSAMSSGSKAAIARIHRRCSMAKLIMVCGDAHVLRYGVNTCIGATGTREVDRTA